MKVTRQTVDLSQYPDLVVIYLGMRANTFGAIGRILKLGPQIQKSVEVKPDGLLLHENFLFGVFPPHVGMRQYWRDFDALESWTRQMPHQQWWKDFLRASSGTGFWHETLFQTRWHGVRLRRHGGPRLPDFSNSARPLRRKVPCFQPAIALALLARLRNRQYLTSRLASQARPQVISSKCLPSSLKAFRRAIRFTRSPAIG